MITHGHLFFHGGVQERRKGYLQFLHCVFVMECMKPVRRHGALERANLKLTATNKLLRIGP